MEGEHPGSPSKVPQSFPQSALEEQPGQPEASMKLSPAPEGWDAFRKCQPSWPAPPFPISILPRHLLGPLPTSAALELWTQAAGAGEYAVTQSDKQL